MPGIPARWKTPFDINPESLENTEIELPDGVALNSISHPVEPYNDGYTHEAQTSLLMIMDMFDSYVGETRCAENFPDVETMTLDLAEKLVELHALIGSKWKGNPHTNDYTEERQ